MRHLNKGRSRHILFVLLALRFFGLRFVFLGLLCKLFVLLQFAVQVVEIEDADNVLLLEDELLNFARNDGGDSAGFLALIKNRIMSN